MANDMAMEICIEGLDYIYNIVWHPEVVNNSLEGFPMQTIQNPLKVVKDSADRTVPFHVFFNL